MSGTFTFRWDRPANRVFVTGDFDDWKTETELDRLPDDGGFEKTVILPKGDHKYKFVVDGNWTTDSSKPTKSDDAGIINNFLSQSEIQELSELDQMSQARVSGVQPESTTMQSDIQDKAVVPPLSSPEPSTGATVANLASTTTPGVDAVPGSFPQTPPNEENIDSSSASAKESAVNEFGVHPLPTCGTRRDEVEAAPKPDVAFSGEAHFPKLSIQDGLPVLHDDAHMEQRETEGRGVLNTVDTSNMNLESSLSIGTSKYEGTKPNIAKDSQEIAKSPVEAAAIPSSVENKVQIESELEGNVSVIPPAEGNTVNGQEKVAVAGVTPTVVDLASAAGFTSAAGPKLEVSSEVQSIVKDNQTEAAAITEKLEQKNELEAELKAEVPAISLAIRSPTAESQFNMDNQIFPVVTDKIAECTTTAKTVSKKQDSSYASGEPEAGAAPRQTQSEIPESDSASRNSRDDAVELKKALESQVEGQSSSTAPIAIDENMKENPSNLITATTTSSSPKRSSEGKKSMEEESASNNDKKNKRKSFFGRLKERFHSGK